MKKQLITAIVAILALAPATIALAAGPMDKMHHHMMVHHTMMRHHIKRHRAMMRHHGMVHHSMMGHMPMKKAM